MKLALFPLSAHLLPGGIMPLRIFEPRYQRMIAQAGDQGFALCMLDPRQPDQEADGLRIGEVEQLPPWRTGRLNADQHSLAKALQEVFEDYPEYAALYRNPDWGDASWVAQRWLEVLPIRLEVLPIPVEQKQWLVAAEDNQPALSLLSGLLVASH